MSVLDLLIALPALAALVIAVLPLPRHQLTVIAFAATTSDPRWCRVGVWIDRA